MGYHYINPSVKGFDVRKPPILVYERHGNRWQLGALEWVFPSKPATAPLKGATYGSFPAACHYKDGTSSSKPPVKKARPDLYLNGVNDRGQRQSAIIFFGDFPRRSMDKVPMVLEPGQSYTVCQAFLIAKGGSSDGAIWVEFDPKHPTKSDVNWRR